jgi:prevent-host-death family protein
MSWPVQEAKARFSELLERSITEGPQIVTKRGIETAVLVPIDECAGSSNGLGRRLKNYSWHPSRGLRWRSLIAAGGAGDLRPS